MCVLFNPLLLILHHSEGILLPDSKISPFCSLLIPGKNRISHPFIFFFFYEGGRALLM